MRSLMRGSLMLFSFVVVIATRERLLAPMHEEPWIDGTATRRDATEVTSAARPDRNPATEVSTRVYSRKM